jgi:hypothetical protein
VPGLFCRRHAIEDLAEALLNLGARGTESLFELPEGRAGKTKGLF